MKLQMTPRFPSRVIAGTGIDASVSNGALTISLTAGIASSLAAAPNVFATKALAQAANVPASATFIIVMGSSAIGNGPAVYQKVVTQPLYGGIQTADGAWWQDAEEVVSVTTLGGVGDNSTDATAAIQNAFDFAGSKTVVGAVALPPGIFKTSAALIWPKNKSINLFGFGPKSSIIRLSHATANGITINHDPFSAIGGSIRNLAIETGAGYYASGFQGSGSTGVGISASKLNNLFLMDNVALSNFGDNAQILGSWNSTFANIFSSFASGNAFYVAAAADGTGTAANTFHNIFTNNVNFSGANGASFGFRCRHQAGGIINKITALGFNKGMMFDPASGSDRVYLLNISQLVCDTSVSDGITFDGTSGAVYSNTVHDVLAANNGGIGAVMKGANLDGMEINGRFRENASYGIDFQGGKNFRLLGSEVNGNGTSAPGTIPGVHIAANVGQIIIADNIIGNIAGKSGQAEPIKIEVGASARVKIVNNDLYNDSDPAKSVITNGSTSTVLISGNSPSSINNSPLTSLFGAVTAGINMAGATRYLGPAGAEAGSSQNSSFIWPAIGTIQRVRVELSVTPGAGESIAFTLYKNNVATAMTGSIATGVFALTLTGALAVADLDDLSIQAVGSAGAPTTQFRYHIMGVCGGT